MDELERGAPSRVVVVSSYAHTGSGLYFFFEIIVVYFVCVAVHFDNLQGEKNYSAWTAYSQSKTANILFAIEFTRRFQDRGIYANGICSHQLFNNYSHCCIFLALHPGVINTELARNSTMATFFYTISAKLGFLKTIPQGAATSGKRIEENRI